MYDDIMKCLNNIETLPKIESDRYFFQGKSVPRVTEILSKMIHEDALMNWANYLGLFKRIKLKDELNKACTIGTYSHDSIEQYIKHDLFNKEDLRKDLSDENMINSIYNCVESFKLWWNDINKQNKIKILGIENKLICPWYGGTYDLLIQIGEFGNYLVDFKTSNHIGYKYFLQLAAYKYILENQNIKLSGVLILQVDKNNPSYEEYALNFNILRHNQFIKECENTFFSLVYAYYNITNVENQFNKIF